jgi:hypothetical protein
MQNTCVDVFFFVPSLNSHAFLHLFSGSLHLEDNLTRLTAIGEPPPVPPCIGKSISH